MRALAVVLTLCGLLSGGPVALAQTDRLIESDRLRSAGKTEEALAVLRAEFADPKRTPRPDARAVYLRQRMLMVLGQYTTLAGLKPEIEAEARKHYDEGLARFARDDVELQTYLHNGMALYYSYSGRNGLAVPLFRKEEPYWERVGDPWRLYLLNDALAKAYWEMGEFDLYRHRLRKSLAAADRHFVVGVRPADKLQWIPYWEALQVHMDFAAQLPDRAMLDDLYARRERIGPRVFNIHFEAPALAAEAYAIAGDLERARALLAQGKAAWERDKVAWANNPAVLRPGTRQLACAEGGLELHLRNHAAALALLERCIRLIEEQRVGHTGAATLLRLRGEAHEGSGDAAKAIADYRESIAGVEASRGSYSVAERAKFFRTTVRGAYWGMARVQAKRAAAGDEAAFFEAMYTSELVRGRQLGELLDAETSRRISPASLKALQQRLPAEAVLLAYTATEGEIILLALTRERVLATVTPYDSRAFTALVRGIAADLARPQLAPAGSGARLLVIGPAAVHTPLPPQTLDARLVEMSRVLFASARPFIADKKRVIVLPDGVMNAVPFELLSASDERYQPLIATHTITASPSLMFIEHAERQRRPGAANLLAMADPQYVRPKTFAGASAEEVQAATRGSRYLQYFQPLPETRSEAQAIAKMFGGEKVELLVGEFALESQIKKRDLAPFSFLHFATHGILGGEVPGIGEPALVFGEEPGEDGFLTASEVSKLRINAQLTVLSACNTGSGEFVTGEGVMGMSRAFLAAGSLSVVVSLWPVASEFTERLMVEFYRELRAGKPAPEALRAAKLEMVARANKTGSRESHPFFWAPFILLGG